MWCAECGSPISRREDGAWPQCCNGLGYWSELAPLARDAWAARPPSNGYHFYPTGKWPSGKAPKPPR